MDMEERSFLRSGGIGGVQQLTDVELNDVEHPQFVNSSLSGDEDLGENNNVTSTSYCVQNPRKIIPIPISSSVVPPNVRPLPVSTSSSCFVASVLKSIQDNNSRTTQDGTVSLESLQKKLSKAAIDGQKELLEKLQRRNEKRSEFMRLKESISKHQTQKKTLGKEYTELVTKCAKKGNVFREKLAKAESMYKKFEDRLNDKMEAQTKLKEKLKHAQSKLEDIAKEDTELSEWTQQHHITVHMKPKNASDISTKDEIVIELRNISRLEPERKFHILADSVSLQGFSVENVYPYFEEAYDVIEHANESQDLVKALRDCVKYWKRDCENSVKSFRHSDKLHESMKTQTMIVDQTLELFKSPPTSNK